ncbi:MAG: MBL fold metallo-hydrolase [Verrucomicrobia bacterium]|nr:MBL fold metallo-hydrolase [Verrucomicrobiota bacterium]
MIQPVLQNAALLADIEHARADFENFHLWWLGQSGFLIQWQGRRLLLDPYLSDSLTRKYANTDKPHVPMTERPVAPECLNFIDVVTSSHNHTDHLDAETLRPLFKANPKLELIIPEANREFVTDRLGIVTDIPIGLDSGKSATVAGFKFTGVPAAHETVEKDEGGRCKYLGYVIEFGNWTIYHSGDTVGYAGMVDLLQVWRIDLALLPINGRAVERRVAGNLNGREAAALAKDLKARVVIPCHYEMFEFNTATPEEFVRAAESLAQPCRVLRCGERWSSADLPAIQ